MMGRVRRRPPRLTSLFARQVVVRPRPWVWTYDLVVICFGFTSACFFPFCIPLLIFWLKPPVKEWFGKKD